MCCFSQQTEATLLCLSGMEVGEAGKLFRRFSEEYVLAYCDALNSWLADLPPVNPWADIEALYVDEAQAHTIAEESAAILVGDVEKLSVSVPLIFAQNGINLGVLGFPGANCGLSPLKVFVKGLQVHMERTILLQMAINERYEIMVKTMPGGMKRVKKAK